MTLPLDSHVHSEWSWDVSNGSMERSCARAVALGLPAIAFTEHLDHTVWTVDRESLDEAHPMVVLSAPDGQLSPPAFDVSGYLTSIERCRELFPGLRVLSGLEVGEPHWHASAVQGVLAAGQFDRVLGSLHCLPDGDTFREPPGMFCRREPHEVVRRYLAEVAVLVSQSDAFSVLAHIDYPVRHWPDDGEPFDPRAFEDEFRHALRATAESGKALEINTVVPLHDLILRWWREEGGDTVTFGSDAHDPTRVARHFREATAMAEAHGFRRGRDPLDFWARSR